MNAKRRAGRLAFAAALLGGGCSPPPEPMTPYLSVAAHETTAARLDGKATKDEAEYDGFARNGMCRGRMRSSEDVCWTSAVNPTEPYLRHAEEHRREAATHRAAATTLRSAEAAACIGVGEVDRDVSPFDHVEDILRVEPLRGGVTRYLEAPQTEGVVVVFRPLPGMTTPWLQHLIDCHLARNAALGNDRIRFKHCLLVPRGVDATVTKAADGFAVTIRAHDKETAEELFRRADLLVTQVKAASAS